MKFSDFYGQSSVAGELRSSFSRGGVVHGFLFVGPEGCGKKTLARICAQALFCLGEDKPCDVCAPCQRFSAGLHPDYIELETGTAQIGVDAVRTLITTLSEKPFGGGNRAVLICKPLTLDAQNALLKTLEEPPEGTVFFLTAPNISSLLPTVVSRMRVINISALDEKTCAAALISKNIEPGRAALLAALSGGIVGKALDMQEDTKFWRAREAAYEFLKPAEPEQAPEIIARLSNLTKISKADFDEKAFLSCVESVLSDVIRFHAGARRIETDKLAQTEAIANEIGVKAACRILDTIRDCGRKLGSYVPWQAAVESLVFELVEVTGGWRR